MNLESTKCIDFFKTKLNNCFDVVDKTFLINKKNISILYLKSIINDQLLSDIILTPLSHSTTANITEIKSNVIKTADIETLKNNTKNYPQILSGILTGKVAIFIDGETNILLVNIRLVPFRAPAEPPTSAVIYGPRVGFNENIETNLAMLRRRLPTPDLIVENFIVGKYTQTKVVIFYIKSIANKRTVKEISKILKRIDIDGVVDSNYILSYFQKGSTMFKRTGVAEKPDIVTAKILEGRVAILVDGSPIALTLPFMVFEDLQNSNDYYTNSIYTSFLRVLRLIGIFVAIMAPGVYLALRLYHYKVLPLRFLITISNSTEGLPFTPFVEILFILILFQILYEVSLRLPQYLGLATSIVGALILGQTGVAAGLISPPGVVIIAVSIIAVYTVSDEIAQITLLRAIFLIIGGTIGLLGIVGTMVFFVNELATLNQFGTSYLAPYAPRKKGDMKDGLIKQPLPSMKRRPESINSKNKVRQKNGQ